MKDYRDVFKEFKKYFNVEKSFIDKITSMISGKYIFDIVLFDEYILETYNYDENVEPLQSFILRKFGKEAIEFIEEIMKGEVPLHESFINEEEPEIEDKRKLTSLF